MNISDRRLEKKKKYISDEQHETTTKIYSKAYQQHKKLPNLHMKEPSKIQIKPAIRCRIDEER